MFGRSYLRCIFSPIWEYFGKHQPPNQAVLSALLIFRNDLYSTQSNIWAEPSAATAAATTAAAATAAAAARPPAAVQPRNSTRAAPTTAAVGAAHAMNVAQMAQIQAAGAAAGAVAAAATADVQATVAPTDSNPDVDSVVVVPDEIPRPSMHPTDTPASTASAAIVPTPEPTAIARLQTLLTLIKARRSGNRTGSSSKESSVSPSRPFGPTSTPEPITSIDGRWMNQPDAPMYTKDDLGFASQVGRESQARAEETSLEIRFAILCNSLPPPRSIVEVLVAVPSLRCCTIGRFSSGQSDFHPDQGVLKTLRASVVPSSHDIFPLPFSRVDSRTRTSSI